MGAEPPNVAIIERAIRDYLDAHPYARDTAEGVRQWWLVELPVPCTADAVQHALDRLVADGAAEGRVLRDGRVVYGAGRPNNP